MTIIEAIKSGLPFQRGNTPWLRPSIQNAALTFEAMSDKLISPTGSMWTLTWADLTAGDWKTKPQPREWAAWLDDKGALCGSASLSDLKPGSKTFKVREVTE